MNLSMRNRMKSGLGVLLPVGLLILFMAGCGPSQKEMMAKDQLERAKKAYAEAKANPDVGAYAPLELQDAGKTVQAAEKAKETDDTIQLSYLAERKSRQAMTVAEGKAAEKEIARLNTEKAELIAQKQTIAANKAQAKTKAEMEKTEAANRMAEAEKEKAAMAAAKAEQNKKALTAMNAQLTERGIVLMLGGALFSTGKAELSTKAYDQLAKVSDYLKKTPGRNVLIEGFTDDVGNDEKNKALSLERASVVKARLMKNGIKEERITAVGYGEEYPVDSNKTSAGRAKNRRVELIILEEGVKAETQMRK